MKYSTESLGDLEKGIKQLLLEDRCSFSDSDRVLLNDCLNLVISCKTDSNTHSEFNVHSLVQVVELVIKLIYTYDHFKNLF